MKEHPITPPPELVEQWYDAIDNSSTSWKQELATQAARWGADRQLAICVKWLEGHGYDLAAPELQEHCRPAKPQPPQTVVIDGRTYRLEE